MSTATEVELLHGVAPLFTAIQRHTFFNELNKLMAEVFPGVTFSFFYHDEEADCHSFTLESSNLQRPRERS